MNNITAQLYRIIVPKYFRKKILAKRLPLAIKNYYNGLTETPSEEIKVVLDYLEKNPITAFPYDFQDEYKPEDIEVYFDQEKRLSYVLQDNKRLYFKKRWRKRKIQNHFNLLSKEQDIRSPHRYLTDQFQFEEGEILVDAGVAEGNFALNVVEKASKLILFEADKEWIEPLQSTFAPWKDKVEIVNKFVSNQNDSKHTTIDHYISPGPTPMFLKIDVEGAESLLLNGSTRILSEQKPLKVAICTYHKQNDEKEFSAILTQKGFESTHSDGYMLFFYDKKMKAPYFRRGLLRAIKK